MLWMLNCGFYRVTGKNWWKPCYVRWESSECNRYQGYQSISQQSGRLTTNFSILIISQDASVHKHCQWWVTWYCSCFEIRPHVTRQTSLRPQTWHGSCVTPQGSASCPSVLDSSEISTENGRTSRFPRPELEISFSPLQPNRMALRRQGEENTVTVKITHSTRKRKSGEMDKVRTNQTDIKYTLIYLPYLMQIPQSDVFKSHGH